MHDIPDRSRRSSPPSVFLLAVPPPLLLRLAIAVAVTATFIAVLVLSAPPPRVHAADVFGALRGPGEPAFIVGHRGDRSTAPENTMPALERAMDGPMAFVETDVQMTRDGVPVLFHDVTLERITGVQGRVSDHTLEELRLLDAGRWYAPEYAGETIPTLEEFLVALAEREARALIELKAIWSADELGTVIELIERHGLRGRTVLQSFSLETMFTLQSVAPHHARILLARELPADPVPLAERLGVIAIGTTAKSVVAEPGALAALHDSGIGVLCYTLNSEDRWAEVSALGVDGIITDEPSELDSWLAATAPGT